jgi:CDP-paratose 2-epimerase
MKSLRDRFGLCQWFHFQDYRSVERTVELLTELGVHHLRTGISWADWHRPQGEEWYRWQMEQLQDFEMLVSIWHTPPSISENGKTSGPPRRLQDYADFIGQILDVFGDRIACLELWNEPNNRLKWDFPDSDPLWQKFAEMIRQAAEAARGRNALTVLGGIIPVDPAWLDLMADYGALQAVDVLAIHGFPGMWWDHHPNWEWYQHWAGWSEKIGKIASHADGRPVWITETGLASWNLVDGCEDRFDLQIEMLNRAINAPAERIYWYSLIDLDPARDAIEGFHVDENEYHLGLVRHDGTRKAAWDHLYDLIHDESVSRDTSHPGQPSSGVTHQTTP